MRECRLVSHGTGLAVRGALGRRAMAGDVASERMINEEGSKSPVVQACPRAKQCRGEVSRVGAEELWTRAGIATLARPALRRHWIKGVRNCRRMWQSAKRRGLPRNH